MPVVLVIRQTDGSLFSAEFNIMQDNDIIGTASVRGKVGSPETICVIKYFGHTWRMVPIKSIGVYSQSCYRPYTIRCDGADIGQIMQTEQRHSIKDYTVVDKMLLRGINTRLCITSYENRSNATYAAVQGDTILATIDVSPSDTKYVQYTIDTTDVTASVPAAIHSVYLYTCTEYKPGAKIRIGKPTVESIRPCIWEQNTEKC